MSLHYEGCRLRQRHPICVHYDSFYATMKDRPLETMGEPEIRDFPLYQISIGKTNGSEIVRFFSVIGNLRDRAMFETVYGAGLRRSEIVHLRVQDIDSKQMRILVHHGKGGKDRFTLLSERSLDILRAYWKEYRPNHPEGYLFYARSKDKHILTPRSVDNAVSKYKAIAGLPDSYTVHTLRHCFATHLLESGVEVCQIKELLGHALTQTTAFYLHLGNLNKSITSPLDTLPKKRGRKPKMKDDA